MEAKELRIGNCVNEGARLVILHDGFGIDHARNFDPIELTEDWLIKFGFVKVIDYPIFQLNGLQIEFNGFDHEWGCGLTDKKTITKYVHQLQNLYFALCGEELQLKN